MRNRELVVVFPIFDAITKKFVLLGERQCEPWKGLFSGFGGNIEEGDKNPRRRQVIELKEEARILVQENHLKKMAEFIIDIKGKEAKLLHVYITDNFFGKGENTKEMRPEWFSFRDLPFGRMIKGDEFWVPKVLAGEYLHGTIFRDENFNFLDIEIKPRSPRFFSAA